MVLFRVVFVTRRPFLESPGNLSGLKLYFKIKIEKKANYFVALKPVHFVSLADESIIKISKLEIPIFSIVKTEQLYGPVELPLARSSKVPVTYRARKPVMFSFTRRV